MSAAWKIDGFVVTPTMCAIAIRSFRFPDCNRCRDKSSSHRETPASDSAARLAFDVLCGVVMVFNCLPAGCPL